MNDVDICNMALANIGQPPIQSLADLPGRTSDAQKACKLRYVEARQECLTKTQWNFATTWRQGEELTNTTPRPPWTHVYEYPADALRVFEIQRSYAGEKDIPFEVNDGPDGEGRVILTDHESPVFIYVRDKTDANTYSMEFVQALSWCLAAKIAMPITKSRSLMEKCLQIFTSMVGAAVTRDENEGVLQTDIEASYHEAR